MIQPLVRRVVGKNRTNESNEFITEIAQVTTVARAVESKRTYDSDIIEFRGLNRRESLQDNEFISMTNLSSDAMPYVTTRASRELIQTVSIPNGVFSNGLKLSIVDGTSFKYDNVIKGTVTNGKKCMVNMNGNVVIFPDKKFYNYVTDTFGSFSSPDLDYVCEWNNRLWGVKNGDPYIYASSQGDFTNWEVANTEVMAAYFVDTGGNDSFKGIVSFGGHVTSFKSDQIFEIYGNKPSNFQVIGGAKNGLLSNDAVVETDSMLFFLSNRGPMVYTGGLPEAIDYPLNLFYSNGAFGTDKRKVYMSIFDGAAYGLYVYDPRFGMWHKEDNLNVIQFTYHLGYLYALCADGKLLKFNTNAVETIAWECETKMYDDKTFNKKEYQSLNIKVKVEAGSSFNVHLKVDDDTYTLYKTITNTNGIKEIIIPINQNKCSRFQVKFSGTGKFTMYHMQRQFTIGSELPNNS